MFNSILIIHLLAAAVWTGGHLILVSVILPKAISTADIDALLQFEQQFEKVGMPALGVQIVTGFLMAYQLIPNVKSWFALDNDLSILISIKLLLLLLTTLVALHARFYRIPNLSILTLKAFSINIILVTLFSVSFVIVGTLFRTGFS